jgi:nucleoid DNA-binding protein
MNEQELREQIAQDIEAGLYLKRDNAQAVEVTMQTIIRAAEIVRKIPIENSTN